MNETVYIVSWTLEIAPIDREAAQRLNEARDVNYFRIPFPSEDEAQRFVDELRCFLGDKLLMLSSLAKDGITVKMAGAKVRA